MKKRCDWTREDELMNAYHDEEWGVPVHDDKKHFEFLLLDAFQAGLSWKTILYKRENFRKAFADFDVQKVAKFTEKQLEKLMLNEGVIRNRLKIYGSVMQKHLYRCRKNSAHLTNTSGSLPATKPWIVKEKV